MNKKKYKNKFFSCSKSAKWLVLIKTCSKLTKWLIIMTCSKSAKWLMTCSKLAKWLLSFLTCSKLAKWLIIMTSSKLAVLNKTILGTFFKSQKGKNRLKRHINYGFLFTWEKQWEIKQSKTLF